jgi:hypothetical protein
MDEKMNRFFQEIDQALVPIANGQRLDLYHLGRSALILRYQATFSTMDIDAVDLRTPLSDKAGELFGKDSAKAKELGLYLDLVPDPLPPLPGGYQTRSSEVHGNWQVIRLWELEPNDLAATKMKSFRPQDREDLRFLCDQGLMQAEKLRESMEKAWIWTMPKDGDDLRDRAFANMEKVIDYLEGRSRNL